MYRIVLILDLVLIPVTIAGIKRLGAVAQRERARFIVHLIKPKMFMFLA